MLNEINSSEIKSGEQQKLQWSAPTLETCKLEQTQASPGSGGDGGATTT